jgi:hypothetical protein
VICAGLRARGHEVPPVSGDALSRVKFVRQEKHGNSDVEPFLTWLRHAGDHPEVWFSCPHWLRDFVLGPLPHWVNFAQLVRPRDAGMPAIDLDAASRLKDLLSILGAELVREPWSAILDLTANAAGFRPAPTLQALLERSKHFRRHSDSDSHHKGEGDPAAKVDRNELFVRLWGRAVTVFSWLTTVLGRGVAIRTALYRYKARSELYHHGDLKRLPERKLRENLGAYLFDAGFLPISEATEGSYRPDLLNLAQDEAGVEVIPLEIKARDRLDDVLEGYAQSFQYAMRRGSSRCFYVPFFRKNWCCDIPEETRTQGIRVTTIQIDISGQPARGRNFAVKEVWNRIQEKYGSQVL